MQRIICHNGRCWEAKAYENIEDIEFYDENEIIEMVSLELREGDYEVGGV